MDWLQAFAELHASKWMRAPFAIRLDGQPWTCATNGRILVAVEGADGIMANPDVPERFHAVLAAPAEWTDIVGVHRIQSWCGVVPPPQPACRLCHDSGVIECECGLTQKCICAYQGRRPEVRPGWLAGLPINRWLLGYSLFHFSGQCRYGAFRSKDKKVASRVSVWGDNWKVVVAALEDKVDGLAEAPHFEKETKDDPAPD